MELVHNRSMNMEKETPHTLRIIHHSIMLTEQTIFNLHVAPELSCVSVVFFYFKYLWSPSLLMFYSTLVVFLDQSRRNSASTYRRVLHSNRKRHNCRPSRSCMQTDRVKNKCKAGPLLRTGSILSTLLLKPTTETEKPR